MRAFASCSSSLSMNSSRQPSSSSPVVCSSTSIFTPKTPWRSCGTTSKRLVARSPSDYLAMTSRSRSRHVIRASDDDKPRITPQTQDPNELPWVRREREEEAARAAARAGMEKGPPFAVYLVASALVAIAAVGSVFEFVNKNAIFGVLPPSSPLYAPVLGLFALTGLPSAGWLFFKAVQAANEESARQDRLDGFDKR